VNLSSLVKKWDKTNVNRGPTESNKPATFDCTYCSDQLIKEKGIKLPITPIKIINVIFFFEPRRDIMIITLSLEGRDVILAI
jgi:hypothetical protein